MTDENTRFLIDLQHFVLSTPHHLATIFLFVAVALKWVWRTAWLTVWALWSLVVGTFRGDPDLHVDHSAAGDQHEDWDPPPAVIVVFEEAVSRVTNAWSEVCILQETMWCSG